MINFRLQLSNPWFKPNEDFENKDYAFIDRQVSKNKSFELQISKFESSDIFEVALDLRWWGSDHQGPRLEINVLGYMFMMQLYDCRHWNYDVNRWFSDEDADQEAKEWREQQLAEKTIP
jgi:hypothetical protein